MKEQIARKLVDALRSGKYGQTSEILRAANVVSAQTNDGAVFTDEPANSFCCLGVLCDLYAQEHPEATWEPYGDAGSCVFNPADNDDRNEELLPAAVMKWADMYSRSGAIRPENNNDEGEALVELRACVRESSRPNVAALADANDKGATFSQLADFIEQHWEAL